LILTESLLLAVLGGAASVLVAWLGVRALGSVNPETTLRVARDNALGAVALSSIQLDWVALAFTFGVALVVGLTFGLAPALATTRASIADALKDGGPEAKRGDRRRSFTSRRLLVVSEVALALILLAGSGLMIRSLGQLLATNVGFDPQNVLTVRLSLPRDGGARDSLPSFYTQLLDRMRAIPGVTDAAINSCPPLSGGCAATAVRLPEHPEIDMAHSPSIGVDWASPTWFATMHVPVKRGRVFTTADRIGGPQVVVLNEAAARKLWPNENPIGRRVELGMSDLNNAEVIGIVGDVRQRADSAMTPNAYAAYYQAPMPDMMIFIRTSRHPAALGAEVRRAIHEVAPSSPVYDMQTMSDRAADATARARFSAVLLSLFAATALSLAAIGIYGVMSLAVTARTREIGIRIALGADRGRVQRLVVGEGAALVAIGAVAGIGGALLCTRVLRTLLFDVTPSDPITYVAIVVLLGAAALLASWLPARRAARVDPLTALRAD
ncbi:MAG TPA: FtsX-like permease family protein, partial [Gemmatimonadaceae bacterium]|nr:FtsX-like permease family protein [Gemmatimonadaceae bacterium]